MTGSVDDVDFVAVVEDRGLLGGDGDAAFVLLVARVHNEGLAHFCLVVAKSVGLLKKAVDERGFAVVDVRDDGDVSDFVLVHSG